MGGGGGGGQHLTSYMVNFLDVVAPQNTKQINNRCVGIVAGVKRKMYFILIPNR